MPRPQLLCTININFPPSMLYRTTVPDRSAQKLKNYREKDIQDCHMQSRAISGSFEFRHQSRWGTKQSSTWECEDHAEWELTELCECHFPTTAAIGIQIAGELR